VGGEGVQGGFFSLLLIAQPAAPGEEREARSRACTRQNSTSASISFDLSCLHEAELDQRVDLVRLVEHRVDAELRTAPPDVGRRIVAEHHHLLHRPAGLAGLQHAEAAALLEEEIDDDEVPVVVVPEQPCARAALGLGETDDSGAGEFFERANEVFTDREVVFDDISLQSGIHAEPLFL